MASASSSLEDIISRLDAKNKALVQDWREQRDRAFALFDVCIDVIARVPVLGDKTVYPRTTLTMMEKKKTGTFCARRRF